MSVTVVIPVLINKHEQIQMTARCIDHAKRSPSAFKTIIVETGSDWFSDSADIYVKEKEKTQANKSINRGFKLVDTEYTVLLTNDVFVEPNWIDSMLECFKNKADCGVATLASTQFNHVRKDEIKEGIWFSVAMLRTQLLKDFNYFDEHYPDVWDDSDLIMRLSLAGYKSYRNYNSIAGHLVRATHGDNTEKFLKGMELFKQSFEPVKEHRIYKVLTEGTVL